jgi:hypothetical protein
LRRLAIASIILLLLTSCSGTSVYKIDDGNRITEGSDRQYTPGINVLKTEEIDLDGDNVPENIEVLEVMTDKDGIEKLSGMVRVDGKNGRREIMFKTGGSRLIGVFKDLKVRDINGDGLPEVFITNYDVGGGGYTLNYFFLYNYKSNKSLIFDQQFSMDYFNSFIQSFSFKYKHPGMVLVGYKGADNYFTIDVHEETNGEFYNSSWIDPSPVVIQEGQGKILSNVEISEGKKGSANIKVPLLIFGGSTSNVIGEVDVFLAVDSELKPFIERFEIYRLEGDSIREKIGEKECLE